ncbi:MAG TPA: hypothetical protein VF322_08425 [Gammaproteobacteria bacterium]
MNRAADDRDPTSAEALREPGGATAERLASKAHEAIDKAATTASQAEQHVRTTATKAADAARRSEQQVEQRLGEGVERLRRYVERNPMASAGIAFAAGVILSSLLRR